MVRENNIKLDVETRGMEEAIEQLEDLREAISTAPRVVIKNPRDCTITVDASEFWSRQEAEQSEPEAARTEPATKRYGDIKSEKLWEQLYPWEQLYLREQLYRIMMECKSRYDCDSCPIKCVCEKGGSFFSPYRWEFEK